MTVFGAILIPVYYFTRLIVFVLHVCLSVCSLCVCIFIAFCFLFWLHVKETHLLTLADCLKHNLPCWTLITCIWCVDCTVHNEHFLQKQPFVSVKCLMTSTSLHRPRVANNISCIQWSCSKYCRNLSIGISHAVITFRWFAIMNHRV